MQASNREVELAKELLSATGGVGGEIDNLLKKGAEYKGLDERTLLRFLRAEKLNVKNAATRLREYATWRNDTCPFRSIRESEVSNEIEHGKAFLCEGRDKQGRPMLVVIGCKHFTSKSDRDEAKLFVLDTLSAVTDHLPSCSPDAKFNLMVDLRDVSFGNLDTALMRQIFVILERWYPERVHTLWFCNAPAIFWGAWKLVSPFVDPSTKQKIKFVYMQDGTFHDVLDRFETKDFPAHFGGKASLIPINKHGLPPPGPEAAEQLASSSHHHIQLPPEVEEVPQRQDISPATC